MTHGRVSSYEDLLVWRAAMEIARRVYGVSARFPREERFGLTSQVRRAAVSIPSNIAEGHARHSTREFLRFISISMGSIAEVETQLRLAVMLGYTQEVPASGLLASLDELGRMLRALKSSLESRIADDPPFPSP